MVALLAQSLPDPSPFADTGVDDHTVDSAKCVGQLGKHLRHLLVIVDVQRCDGDLGIRIPLQQLGFEFVEPVGSASAQRQVTPLGSERASHPRAQPGARAGDEDLLASHPRSIATAELLQ
jgi:hypothetical protein